MSTSGIRTSIIFLTGRKSSGKDSVANFIRDIVGKDKVEILAFADPLKAACKALFLLTDEQLHDEKAKETIDSRWGVTPRRMFQRQGDLQRDILPHLIPELKFSDGLIFTQNMSLRIKEILDRLIPPYVIVISDGRLPDEHTFIKSLPYSTSIRLIRDTGAPVDTHISENGTFKTDMTWNNNGSIDDLRRMVNDNLGYILRPTD